MTAESENFLDRTDVDEPDVDQTDVEDDVYDVGQLDLEDRHAARQEDRQGLGLSRGRTEAMVTGARR